MRTLLSGERAITSAATAKILVKVEVQDADGAWQDWSAYVIGASISETIDQPVGSATVKLRRAAGSNSLAPLMEGSPLNVDSGAAYAPAIDIARLIRISTSTTAVSGSAVYREVFSGRVDSVAWEQDPIVLSCSDLGAFLMDTQIEAQEWIYSPDGTTVLVGGTGTTQTVTTSAAGFALDNYVLVEALTASIPSGRVLTFSDLTVVTLTAGANAGDTVVYCDPLATNIANAATAVTPIVSPAGTLVPVQTVMQALVDRWPNGITTPTLSTPTSPAWQILGYQQDRVKVLEAIRALALQIGWDLRYRYNSSHASVLTFLDPSRDSATVHATIAPSEYRDVKKLSLSLANVRNVGTVSYGDGTVSLPADPASDPSVVSYGRRYLELEPGDNIDTAGEATAYLQAALDDLSGAPAEQDVETNYLWFVQLYDRYTFSANGVHYDTDQTLSVVGYQHTFENGEAITTLTTAGRVIGAYAAWLRRQVAPGGDVTTGVFGAFGFRGTGEPDGAVIGDVAQLYQQTDADAPSTGLFSKVLGDATTTKWRGLKGDDNVFPLMAFPDVVGSVGTDDTTAIQAAFTEAYPSMVLDAGRRFQVDAVTLATTRSSLRGDGGVNTALIRGSTGTVLTVTGSSARLAGFSVRGRDAFSVVVGPAGALAGATSVPVDALTRALPSGTILRFSGARTATLTAGAAAGATTLTVSALASSLVDNDAASVDGDAPLYAGNNILVTSNGVNLLDVNSYWTDGLALKCTGSQLKVYGGLWSRSPSTSSIESTISAATMTSITTAYGQIIATAGSWITQGVAVGDRVMLAGHSTLSNNGTWCRVDAVTATTITVAQSSDITADAAPDTTATITLSKSLPVMQIGEIGSGINPAYCVIHGINQDENNRPLQWIGAGGNAVADSQIGGVEFLDGDVGTINGVNRVSGCRINGNVYVEGSGHSFGTSAIGGHDVVFAAGTSTCSWVGIPMGNTGTIINYGNHSNDIRRNVSVGGTIDVKWGDDASRYTVRANPGDGGMYLPGEVWVKNNTNIYFRGTSADLVGAVAAANAAGVNLILVSGLTAESWTVGDTFTITGDATTYLLTKSGSTADNVLQFHPRLKQATAGAEVLTIVRTSTADEIAAIAATSANNWQFNNTGSGNTIHNVATGKTHFFAVNGTSAFRVTSDGPIVLDQSHLYFEDDDFTLKGAVFMSAHIMNMTNAAAGDMRFGVAATRAFGWIVDNVTQVIISDGFVHPQTTNDISLGKTGQRWSDFYAVTGTITNTLTAGAFSGPLTGAVTGNASTATALQTARTINGVSFNGTADITISAVAAAGTLTGTTLASNVVASSLTSVGTLSSLGVTNNVAITSGVITIGGTQVLTSRRTGWSAATGTATRTSFATSTVTLSGLAEAVKALIDDSLTHGWIGA